MSNPNPLFAVADKTIEKRQVVKIFDDGSIHVYPEAGQDYKVLTEFDADVAQKADKVTNATSGNFAGLDANGNLTDSGCSAASFDAAGAAAATVTNVSAGTADTSGQVRVVMTKNGSLSNIDATVAGWDSKQNKITASNKLASDLVDDADQTNKFVTASEKTAWSNKQNAIEDSSAEIASVSNSNIVTLRAGISQVGGKISNTSGDNIALAAVAKTGNYTDLSGKPLIPTATSELTNDSGFITDAGVTSVSLVSGTNNGTLKLTVNGSSTDNIAVKGLGTAAYKADSYFGTATAVSAAQSTADTAKSIAEGAIQAISYVNISAFVTAFNDFNNTKFRTGQNIYIQTHGVPDLWIYSVESTSSTYTYVDDATFTNALSTTPYTVQVGYYKVAALETEKVDLTVYQTKTDNSLATTSKNVVGAINEVRTTAAAAQTTADAALPRSAGDSYPLTGNLYLSGNTNATATGIYGQSWNNNQFYMGAAKDQTDGTFLLGSLKGTNYRDGLAIGGGSGNLLWKGNQVLTTENGVQKTVGVTNVSYNSTSKKIQKTINSVVSDVVTLAAVAISGDYNDLSNAPTIPTVNNGTLTITQGSNSDAFTADQANDTNITITPAKIGAEPVFIDGNAGIASLNSSTNIVTLKAGVAQSGGAISNSSGSDITLAKVAKTGSYNDLSDKIPAASTSATGLVTTGEQYLSGDKHFTSNVFFESGVNAQGSDGFIAGSVTNTKYKVGEINNDGYALTLPLKTGTIATLDDIVTTSSGIYFVSYLATGDGITINKALVNFTSPNALRVGDYLTGKGISSSFYVSGSEIGWADIPPVQLRGDPVVYDSSIIESDVTNSTGNIVITITNPASAYGVGDRLIYSRTTTTALQGSTGNYIVDVHYQLELRGRVMQERLLCTFGNSGGAGGNDSLLTRNLQDYIRTTYRRTIECIVTFVNNNTVFGKITSTANDTVTYSSLYDISNSGGSGSGSVSDVQMNGTSIVSSGIAYIPAATTSDTGVITTGPQSFAGAKTFEGAIVSRSAVAYNKTQGSSYAVGLGDDGTGNGEALYYSKPISGTDYYLNIVADTPGNAPSDVDTILTLPWKSGTLATLDDVQSAGIPELTTQYIRIWDLEPGIYKWTYNGGASKYYYYGGATNTSNYGTITGAAGDVAIVIVTLGYKGDSSSESKSYEIHYFYQGNNRIDFGYSHGGTFDDGVKLSRNLSNIPSSSITTTTSVTSGSSALVTSGGVYTAIHNMMSLSGNTLYLTF